MARLDKLGPARETLQTGAVLGSEFSYELLHVVHQLDDVELQRRLRTLTNAELLYVRGIAPEATYQFKHALIRDAAYEALLKSRRRELHRLVASTINQNFHDIKDAHPEVLARHWAEAGQIELAVAEWSRAANAAAERNAFREAQTSYRHALELVERLPGGQQRAHQELQLQLSLGITLIATDGYSASAVQEAYGRARELCQQVGDNAHLAPILGGLWQFHVMRGQFHTVREIGEQLLTSAKTTLDPAVELAAEDALAQAFFVLGEQDQAKAHLEQTLRLYNPENHRRVTLLCGGEDPGVACSGFLALNLWLRGYPDQAISVSQQTNVLAEKLHHPLSLAHALTVSCKVHLWNRRAPTEEQVEALIRLASEHGFSGFLAIGSVLRGAALEEKARREEIASMREGLAAWMATGALVLCPFLFGLVAQTCKQIGWSRKASKHSLTRLQSRRRQLIDIAKQNYIGSKANYCCCAMPIQT
jgi:tetratricopeptide (TPR) repeat protein